jgi:cysteine desulfuration protein SufE
MDLPNQLEEIISEFKLSEGREKLELLLDYAQRLPPLPDWLNQEREKMESVPECMTPVFITSRIEAGKMEFFFDVPPESPTVRGFAAIMKQGLDHSEPEEVLAIPAEFYLELELEKILTQQRLNGFTAILAHMKKLAFENLSK